MAESNPEASCSVCRDLFTDPVILPCSHSFCESCLTTWWSQRSQRSCPICKQLFHGAQPTRNLALRDMVQCLRQERDQRRQPASGGMCSLHDEKLKLFCHDDQQLMCVICRDSQQHQNHKCAPICEVAAGKRTELLDQLDYLITILESFEQFKLMYDAVEDFNKSMADQTEKSIRAIFRKYHDFLRKEENDRVDTLKKEAEQKSDLINVTLIDVNVGISSLKEKVQAITQELETEDLPFMQNFKSTLKKSQFTLVVPEALSVVPGDFEEHLKDLSLRVGEKMKDIAPEEII